MRAPLIFGLELVILFAAGSYVMGRLVGVSGFGGSGTGLGRMAFYLLIFPGVVLHESAHYLTCLLTATKVLHFAPFSPRRSVDARLMLGYVRHERRGFPIEAIIGLAPILLNPLGILLVTALLTPLTFEEVSNPSFGVVKEGIVASDFLGNTPLLAAAWTYLSLSFALGSVPSRKDLSSLPVLLLIFGSGILVVGFAWVGPDGALMATLNDLFTLVARLYALPAAVAAVAAVLVGLWERTIRY